MSLKVFVQKEEDGPKGAEYSISLDAAKKCELFENMFKMCDMDDLGDEGFPLSYVDEDVLPLVIEFMEKHAHNTMVVDWKDLESLETDKVDFSDWDKEFFHKLSFRNLCLVVGAAEFFLHHILRRMSTKMVAMVIEKIGNEEELEKLFAEADAGSHEKKVGDILCPVE